MTHGTLDKTKHLHSSQYLVFTLAPQQSPPSQKQAALLFSSSQTLSFQAFGNPQGCFGFGGGFGIIGATDPLPVIEISAHALKVSCLLSGTFQLFPAT